MSGPSVPLSGRLPLSLEEAQQYLAEYWQAPNGESRVRAALNDALGIFEAKGSGCGRSLMARTYRTAETITASIAQNAKVATGTGFDGHVYDWDDILNSSLPQGTIVEEATSDTSLALNRGPAEAISSGTFTVGSSPVRVSGTGDRTLFLPDHPVIELISVQVLRADGSVQDTLDTSGWAELGDTGVVHLPSDVVPRGTRNLKVSYSAGYQMPSATRLGDPEPVARFKRGILRLAQVLMADELNAIGRAVSKTLLREGINLGSFEMPADIQSLIDSFTDVA